MNQILSALHKFKDGYVSGEDLADKLGVSRTSVFYYIETLREHGYVIEAHPRLGYRLLDVPDRLFPDEIQRDLKTEFIANQVWVYDKTVSTNDVAWDMAIKGAVEGGVVLAEQQTKGRGRLNRSWFSPKRKGLYFSLVLRPQVEPSYAPMITIAASIAVSMAIIKCTGLSVWIKWPNDIFIDGKKAGGILTEMSTELDRIKFVILGIGINTNLSEDDFPEELKNKATGVKCDRLILLKEVLISIEKYYKMLNEKRYDDIKNEWKNLSFILGKRVKLAQGDKVYEGQAQGINKEGGLVLRGDDGFINEFSCGDVTQIHTDKN